jgi:phage FluMu protein Com
MIAAAALAEAHEARCPACGDIIKTASNARKRRVQCPRCREVVQLAPPNDAPPNSVDPISPIAALEARLSRLEGLETRIAALENALAAPTIIPFPQPASPPPRRKLKWVIPSDAHRNPALSPEVEEALAYNLGYAATRTITFHAALGAANAQPRAEKLKRVFERAQWTVSGPYEVAARSSDHGLSLAVGSLPLPSQAATAHLALTAAGFGLDSILDPNLRGDETVLVIG